jgi:hypothetical protein
LVDAAAEVVHSGSVAIVVRKYYGLPPLTALAVFEATARHASVKRAAKELNVTPGAVSRQIKLLEEEIGVKLFVRGRSGVQVRCRSGSFCGSRVQLFEMLGSYSGTESWNAR